MIESIQIKNLKGKSGISDIAPLTLITGPNGSGKSALVDGLRWATLGYIPHPNGDMKTNKSIAALASASPMSSVVKAWGETYSRTLTLKGATGQITDDVPEADLPEATQVMLDPSIYFGLTDAKKIETALRLLSRNSDASWLDLVKEWGNLKEEILKDLGVSGDISAVLVPEMLDKAMDAVKALKKTENEIKKREAQTQQSLTSMTMDDGQIEALGRQKKEVDEELSEAEKNLAALTHELKAIRNSSGDRLKELEASFDKWKQATDLLAGKKLEIQKLNEERDKWGSNIPQLESDLGNAEVDLQRLSLELSESEDDRPEPPKRTKVDTSWHPVEDDLTLEEGRQYDFVVRSTWPITDSADVDPLYWRETGDADEDSNEDDSGFVNWEMGHNGIKSEHSKVSADVDRLVRSIDQAKQQVEARNGAIKVLDDWMTQMSEAIAEMEADWRESLDADAQNDQPYRFLSYVDWYDAQVDEAKDEDDGAKEAEVVGQVNAADSLVADLKVKRDNIQKLFRDRELIEESSKRQVAAEERLKEAKSLEKILKEQQTEMMKQIFDESLEVANRFAGEILKGQIKVVGGEVGVVRRGQLLPIRALSGAERTIMMVAISASFAAGTEERLVMIDEFNIVDPVNRKMMMESFAQLIETGDLHQVIVLSSDPADLSRGKETGFTVIETC